MDTPSAPICSPLGVCILPDPPRNISRTVTYPNYIGEILNHAGLCHRLVEWHELEAALPDLRLLVTIGETKPEETLAARLRTWVETGGAWLAVGGVCGMPDVFGVEAEAPAFSSWGGGLSNLGEGYLKPEETGHPVLAHLEIPLHYFNGLPVRAAGCQVLAGILDAHQRPTGRVAVATRKAGKGAVILVTPDVTGAVVRIQQGVAVTRDGVSAPDGTAPVCDDVLKSDDGCVLDWIFDRQPVPGIPGLQAFLQPIADQWRELVLRSIFHLAVEHDIPLAVLWLYPRNLPALAHMSHDTDGNEVAKGWQLLETVAKAEIRTSWCTILPGYPPDVMKAIADAGHEYAMHYDAMSEGMVWGEEQFRAQWAELVELFGGKKPVTNKNHYLRWQGDVELFEWCERLGIQMDQSKGASKTGEAGFNFGTCHVHFPLRPDGTPLDVLELPTPTQDLTVFAPPAIAVPLLKAALKHHGILHLLFHPAHIDKPGMADALVEAAREARRQGLEWWTGEEINAWERARRSVQWALAPTDSGGLEVSLSTETPLPGVTILLLSPAEAGDAQAEPSDEGRVWESTTRWGFEFQATVLDLEPGRDYTVTGRKECQTS